MLDLNDARLFEAALDVLDVGVYLVDRHRKIVYWNHGAEKISGYLRQDVTGRFCRDEILIHTDENDTVLCTTACPLTACMRDGQVREASVYLRHRAGHRVRVRVRAVPLRDQVGTVVGAAEIFEEHSALAEGNRRKPHLEKYGCVDEGTGLPNQRLMTSYLKAQLDLFLVHGIPFSVLLMQLDRLQLFQAAHGQEAVRSILRVVAQTMTQTLRPTDFVGRWLGDQFVAILPLCPEEHIETVGHRLKATVSGSGIEWWGDRLSVAVCVAGTSAVSGDTVELLMARAGSLLKQIVVEIAKHATGGGA